MPWSQTTLKEESKNEAMEVRLAEMEKMIKKLTKETGTLR